MITGPPNPDLHNYGSTEMFSMKYLQSCVSSAFSVSLMECSNFPFFLDSYKSMIKSAMDHISSKVHSCVRFRERYLEENYIQIVKGYTLVHAHHTMQGHPHLQFDFFISQEWLSIARWHDRWNARTLARFRLS